MNEPLSEMVVGTPQAQLSPLVAGYTGYRIEGAPPGLHRGLPSRHLTLIITLDGTADLANMPDPAEPPASFTTLIGGLHTTPALIRHDGHQYGIQLNLTPLEARALLGLPAGELADTVIELGTLLGPVAGELRERVCSASTWTDRFLEFDQVLTQVARQRDGPAPELGWAWHRLAASHGRVEVATLAREVGLEPAVSGCAIPARVRPDAQGRRPVMRFEVAHGSCMPRTGPAWPTSRSALGSTTKAHLHREWRELAGCTPSRWLVEEFPSVHDSPREKRSIVENMTRTPAPTIWPTLIYADAPAAIRFLVEAFGFVEALVVPGDAGRDIAHAELRWPVGGGVMLGSTGDDNELCQRKPGTASIYVVTDTPDALFDRATAAGAGVVRELRDEEYGSRGFTVRDPEGNLWSFGTYRGA